MTTKLTIADRLTIVFPPNNVEPEEIAECGLKVLEENLEIYQDIVESQGGKVFTVDAVNDFNKKSYRVQTLIHNRKVVDETLQAAKEMRQQINEIRSSEEVQDIVAALEQTSDISEVIFEQLEKLMENPGLATKLHEFINNAAGDEFQRVEEELSNVKKQILARDIELSEARARTREVEELLRRCNRVIIKHAFGGTTGLELDFEEVEKTLRMTPRITASDVNRALQHLSVYTNGLANHAPLTGFQLWVEAVAHPESFSTSKVLAYLGNFSSQGFRDIGFLLVAVDALIRGPRGSLTGFKALAVFDILQLWTYLDSAHTNDIKSRFEQAVSVRPKVAMYDNASSLFEKFLLGVQHCLEGIIVSQPQIIRKRGEKFLREINSWPVMSAMAINMSEEQTEHPSSAQIDNDIKMVFLGSDPSCFLYVDRHHTSWIRPENVTIRIDPLSNVWIMHDDLQPHIIAERRFSLQTGDITRMFSLLGGVTYL